MATKQAALEAAKEHADQFRGDFPAWLEENYAIYSEFEQNALRVALNRKHYSARTIAEYIRHNSFIREKGDGWKLNNNRIPDIARLFAILNPIYSELFEFRTTSMRVGVSVEQMARAA